MFQKSTLSSQENNLIGVDYGLTNSGIAVSIDGVVSPLTVIVSKNFEHFQRELETLVFKYKVKKIIFGLPLSADGSENKQSLLVRQAVNNLKKKIKTPILFVNEYASTTSYLSNGNRANLSRKTVQKRNDKEAAAIILRDYIDNLNSSS